jgi:hypothetical protein
VARFDLGHCYGFVGLVEKLKREVSQYMIESGKIVVLILILIAARFIYLFLSTSETLRLMRRCGLDCSFSLGQHLG